MWWVLSLSVLLSICRVLLEKYVFYGGTATHQPSILFYTHRITIIHENIQLLTLILILYIIHSLPGNSSSLYTLWGSRVVERTIQVVKRWLLFWFSVSQTSCVTTWFVSLKEGWRITTDNRCACFVGYTWVNVFDVKVTTPPPPTAAAATAIACWRHATTESWPRVWYNRTCVQGFSDVHAKFIATHYSSNSTIAPADLVRTSSPPKGGENHSRPG